MAVNCGLGRSWKAKVRQSIGCHNNIPIIWCTIKLVLYATSFVILSVNFAIFNSTLLKILNYMSMETYWLFFPAVSSFVMNCTTMMLRWWWGCGGDIVVFYLKAFFGLNPWIMHPTNSIIPSARMLVVLLNIPSCISSQLDNNMLHVDNKIYCIIDTTQVKHYLSVVNLQRHALDYVVVNGCHFLLT